MYSHALQTAGMLKVSSALNCHCYTHANTFRWILVQMPQRTGRVHSKYWWMLGPFIPAPTICFGRWKAQPSLLAWCLLNIDRKCGAYGAGNIQSISHIFDLWKSPCVGSEHLAQLVVVHLKYIPIHFSLKEIIYLFTSRFSSTKPNTLIVPGKWSNPCYWWAWKAGYSATVVHQTKSNDF